MELSNKFNGTFNNMNKLFENINENKEKLKLEIQNVFTKIRNVLNNREDELLLKVDKEYENIFIIGKNLKNSGNSPCEITLYFGK